jgi:hypothetical protein
MRRQTLNDAVANGELPDSTWVGELSAKTGIPTKKAASDRKRQPVEKFQQAFLLLGDDVNELNSCSSEAKSASID